VFPNLQQVPVFAGQNHENGWGVEFSGRTGFAVTGGKLEKPLPALAFTRFRFA
jgi:hypothetical protein